MIQKVLWKAENIVDFGMSGSLSDNVITILEDIEGIFPKYFKPFLVYFENELTKLFDALHLEEVILDKKNIKFTCLSNLLVDLIQINIRTLLYEFHSNKRNGKGTENGFNLNYSSYNYSFEDKKSFIDIYEKYPVLDRIITTKINSQLDLIFNSLEKLLKDRITIEKEFDLQLHSIKNININSGDSHNGGKTVVVYEINNKEKIVFKPHSLSAEVLYNNILSSLNNMGLSERINSLENIDRETYGWQKFINYYSCQSENQIRSYFYRIGVQLTIFHILNTQDLHSENIVASGENPFVFDLETLITNKDRQIYNINSNLISTYYQELNDSVLGVFLLPSNFKNSLFDYDMGGISDEGNQESKRWKSYILENKGTDEIKLVPKPSKVFPKNNRLKLNGEFVNPLNYTTDIIKGFEEAFMLLKDNKNKILNIISNESVVIRQVLRATSVYARFLEASLHPKYLKSERDRENLFQKMYKGSDPNDLKIKARKDSEINALMVNDIPYFSQVGTNNLNLIGNETDIIEDYYNITLFDIVKKKLNNLNENKLNREKNYIRFSLASSIKDIWKLDTERQKLNNKSLFKDCLDEKDFVSVVGSYFLDNAIWNETRTKCTWLLPLIENKKLTIGPINSNLYEGGGVLIFLMYLGKVFEDIKYIELAECGLAGIEDIEENVGLDMDNDSLFTGLGSKIYLYYNFYVLTGKKEYLDKFHFSINKLRFNLSNNYDLISGFSGTLIFLLNLVEREEHNYVDYKLIKLASHEMSSNLFELLTQDLKDNKKHLCGLAHGFSCLSWAMIKSGSVLNETKYIDMGIELIKLENNYYSYEINNWLDLRQNENKENSNLIFWCHGAPGIGLSRVKVLKYLKSNSSIRDDLENVILRLTKYDWLEYLDNTLCHGASGVFDIMREIRNTLGSSVYNQDNFKKQQNLFYKKIRSGELAGDYLPTFMLGFSGIAYSLLREIDDSVPSILSFE